MSCSKIVVVGSSNTDMIVRVPQFPKAGETILGDNFMFTQGGKGANQAVAASRAGGWQCILLPAWVKITSHKTL